MPARGSTIVLAGSLVSWEDEDLNRYFPVGNGRAWMRDGRCGTCRGIVEVDYPDIIEANVTAG